MASARLSRAVTEIDKLRRKRRDLIRDRIKRPEPAGIKVMFGKPKSTVCADEFGDLIPSFGE